MGSLLLFRSGVGTIINIVAISLEEGIYENISEDPVAIFEDEDVSSDILYEILKNDRLSPLAGGFTTMGIGVMGDSLDMPEDDDVLYNRFISAVTSTYNASVNSENPTLVADLVRAFDKGGLRINNYLSEEIAADMTVRFGDRYVSEEDVIEFLSDNAVRVIVDPDSGMTETVKVGKKEAL